MTTNNRYRIDLLGVIAIIVTAVSVVAGLLLAYYFQYSFLDIAKEVLTLLLTGGIETLILSMLISKILELNKKKEQKIKVTAMFKREFSSFRESLRQCAVDSVKQGISFDTSGEVYKQILSEPEKHVNANVAGSRRKIAILTSPVDPFKHTDVEVSFFGHAMYVYEQIYDSLSKFFERNRFFLPMELNEKFSKLITLIEDHTKQNLLQDKSRKLMFARAQDQTPDRTASSFIRFMLEADELINSINAYVE